MAAGVACTAVAPSLVLPCKLNFQDKKKTQQTQLFLCHCSSRVKLKTRKVSTSLGLFLGELEPPTSQRPGLAWAGSAVGPSDGVWGFGCRGWEVTRCARLGLPFTLGGPLAISLTPMSQCISFEKVT